MPRSSSVAVAVTVASDREPVECEGSYVPAADGFILEFYIGGDKFVIEHAAGNGNGASGFTRVAAFGDMSYDIKISDEKSDTLLSTPYGKVRFDVVPLLREVDMDAERVNIKLKYLLAADGVGEIERAVEVTARFSG